MLTTRPLRRDAGIKLVALTREATLVAERLLADADACGARAGQRREARTVGRMFDREQRATHGLAWLATYVEAVRQLSAYAERMHAGGAPRRNGRADRRDRDRRVSGADRRAAFP